MIPLRDNIATRSAPLVTVVLVLAAVVAWVLGGDGGPVLLVANAVVLWIFGITLEDSMGRARYLAFALIGAAVGLVYVPASGAAAAVIAGHLLSYPRARVVWWCLIPPFVGLLEWPPAVLVVLWIVVQIAVGGAVALAGLAAAGAVGLALVKVFVREVKETPPRLPAY